MEDERNWFVGVDWASETHHVRVSDARGRKLGARAFAHSGEGLAAMAAWILELTGAAPEAVFVAIEVPHGPVVESLMERGFRVHSINPKQLDRFRDRFSPAGAKDDSRDAGGCGGAGGRAAHRPALLSRVAAARSSGGRTAGGVAHGGGPETGAQPARQPRPGALVAFLPADARADR